MSTTISWPAALSAAALALLAGCAGVPGPQSQQPQADAETVDVARFSRRAAGEPLPEHWRLLRLPLKTATRYRFVNSDAGVALEARAERSASALHRRVDIDPRRHPQLEWRWRVDEPVAGADKRRADREDSPARLVIAFDGDPRKLDMEERMTMRLASALTGQELPYATLMYVWSNRYPADTVIPNPRTGRVQMIVVQGGPECVGHWAEFKRDVAADYRRVFHEEPGKIVAVGVMTDADNTQASARSLYGDITFRRGARR